MTVRARGSLSCARHPGCVRTTGAGEVLLAVRNVHRNGIVGAGAPHRPDAVYVVSSASASSGTNALPSEQPAIGRPSGPRRPVTTDVARPGANSVTAAPYGALTVPPQLVAGSGISPLKASLP